MPLLLQAKAKPSIQTEIQKQIANLTLEKEKWTFSNPGVMAKMMVDYNDRLFLDFLFSLFV